MPELDFEKLEDVDFKVSRKAFEFDEITCIDCGLKAKKSNIEISLGDGIFIRLTAFVCPKCKKRLLNLNEAKKLDEALILRRIATENFKMERLLSHDGDNWVLRIPKDFNVGKNKADIIPLTNDKFCVRVH